MKNRVVFCPMLLALILTLTIQRQVTAQTNTIVSKIQQYVETAAAGNTLRDTQFGVLAMTVDGDTLVSWQSNRLLIPASNMKLITTGLALHKLGPAYRFETQLAVGGLVADGVLHGDLYIVGHGDPTIAVTDPEDMPLETMFGRWEKMLTDAGIRRIDGHIVGDGRWFDGPIELATWMYQDLGAYYGAGGNGLGFYRNIVDVEVRAAAEPGLPVEVTPVYPELPWMRYTSTAKTAANGTGNLLAMFDTDLAPVSEMRGTMGADSKPHTQQCSNKFGALTCAHYFRNYLDGRNILSTGAADITGEGRLRSDMFVDLGMPADNLRILGSTKSPTLLQIVRRTNQRSDNYYAEALFRTMSRLDRGTADYTVAPEAEAEALRLFGVDPSGVRIADGSGLSRDNWISPDFLCAFLRRMTGSPAFGNYLSTLNHPGDSGYAGRLINESQALKKRICYKSGAMSGVRCYSGYVAPSAGSGKKMIVFSVMVNNCTVPSGRLLPIIDKIIAMIAMEN